MLAIVLAAASVYGWPNAALAQVVSAQPADVITKDLEQLASTLNDPQARQEQREEAARRLVARRTPQARQILSDALTALNPGGQLAVARALAEDPQPDPTLINPLFAALGGNRQITEAASRALANYKSNPEVLTRLIAIVQRRPPAPELVRREVIRAMGSFLDKRTAEVLTGLLSNPDESLTIHSAAADALADLTGITEYGQDPQQWADWWAKNARKSNAEFLLDILPRRSARHDQLRQRYADLVSELQNLLNGQYQTAPPAQRPDILMRYLKSADPEVRAIGARIIRDDALDNKTIPAPARDQLRMMIGDSSPKVRVAVADALTKINDAASLELLLAQLAQETDAQVKAALALAVAPINDLRAVPALLGLLGDSAYVVVRASAQAIEQLGPKIREEDSALARRTADALRTALENHGGGPGGAELRQTLVDAMIPLRQESLLPVLRSLLDERRGEGPEVRRLAIKAIGEIGNPQSAGVIVAALDDRDARVRLEAVIALGNIRTAAEYAQTLLRRLDPSEEPDPSIREKTWLVFQSVLPEFSKEQLASFAEQFKDDPNRQIIVLKELAQQLLKLKMEDELATVRQNIGIALMQLGNYKEAAEYFRLALEYKKTQPTVPGVVIAGLVEDRIKALLLAEQYPEAIDFAGQSVRENPNNQRPIGSAIRQEVERLARLDRFDNALSLIEESRKMTPPLAEQYRQQLADIETDIRRQLSRRNASPATDSTNKNGAEGN